MAPISVNCEFVGCSFKTPEGELSTVVELLKLHCSAKHREVDRDSTKAVTKIEKAKRPEIANRQIKKRRNILIDIRIWAPPD